MLLVPYSVHDIDCILQMMKNHVDYAPEQVMDATQDEDVAFFMDAFVGEQSGILAYLLKDSKDRVNGFMTLNKQNIANKKKCWYITALFARNDTSVAQYVLAMIEEFERLLVEASDICVVVHPAAAQIIEFWKSVGYQYSPDHSIFTNENGVLLNSYIKRMDILA